MFEQEFNLWGLIPGLQCMALYVYVLFVFFVNCIITVTEFISSSPS